MLVDRLVNLVTTGTATLDRVVAITFTEAAAGELKMRLRDALEAGAAEGDGARSVPAPVGYHQALRERLLGFLRRYEAKKAEGARADFFESVGKIEPMDLVRAFVESTTWTFAKTNAATWPHEYVVENSENAEMIFALARHIFEHGSDGRFYSQTARHPSSSRRRRVSS